MAGPPEQGGLASLRSFLDGYRTTEASPPWLQPCLDTFVNVGSAREAYEKLKRLQPEEDEAKKWVQERLDTRFQSYT